MNTLIFYELDDKTIPIKEWLKEMRDTKAQTAILRRLTRLIVGNFGDHKPCRDGVWELRIDVGQGYRAYYSQTGTTVILLLCGGDKRTQSADIDRACEFLKSWRLKNER